MATKTTVKNNRLDVKTSALAYVGAVDLAVERMRDYVNELSKQFAEFEPKDVPAQVNTRVEARRAAVEARVAKLQDALDETYAELANRGDALVKRIRNQQSTQEALKSAKTMVAKAKATRTTAEKTVAAREAAEKRATEVEKAAAKKAAATRRNSGKKSAAATRSNAKATTTAAKKTVAAAAEAIVEAAEKVGD